jgi:hypothetical protein
MGAMDGHDSLFTIHGILNRQDAKSAKKSKSRNTKDSFQYPLDGCTKDTKDLLIHHSAMIPKL